MLTFFLTYFLQVADLADFNDEAGAKQKMQQKMNNVCLTTGSPIESHAAAVLTPYAFNNFQEEFVSAPKYASILVDEGCFHVRHHTQVDGGCKVIWVPRQELISCSCHQFEFSGILCRHVLRVLSTNNCFHIPDQYLPARWRGVYSSCKATTLREHTEQIQLLESMVSTIIAESMETEERLDEACEQIAMVLSHIKELPRPTHNGIDSSRRQRDCSLSCCGQFDHDSSDCPIIEGDNLNGDALGFL